MRMVFRKLTVVLAAAMMLTGCATTQQGTGSSDAATGVIAWGEGGGTDSIMRPLIDQLNGQGKKKIDAVNRSGMAGAMALQYVYDQEADGNTLLMSAENPALYGLLGYGEQGFEDFNCVLLIGSETVGVIVKADSEWQTFSEMVEAAKNGREILEATTNVGGMPWTLTAMTQDITEAKFTQVWYDGDKSAMEAVANGEVDFTFCKLQIGAEAADSGKIRYLSLIADQAAEGWENIPPITDEYPEFAKFLPWGPFYGVFVKEGTPETETAGWEEALQEAFRTEEYQKYLSEAYIEPSGVSGEEAAAYIKQWQDNTLSILSEVNLDQHIRFKEAE